jgi:uncharacterized repeat protein (TIGR01451 family)
MGVRRAAAVLFVLVMALLTAVHAPGRAEAAITTPFTVRFDVNTNGSILLRGNSNLTCPTVAAGCPQARNGSGSVLNNNNFTMAYADADGDPVTTFNDSNATLAVPPGSSVLFAGLYWGADSTLAPGSRNQVLFRTPAAAWQPVTASSLYASGANYQGFADVTSLVAGGGNGVYGVANIQASLGTGQYAGWSLAVAYRNPAEDLRSLRIYDGFGSISNSGSLIIPLAGFETPHSGAVHARIGAVAYEGDRGTVGDSFLVDGQPLSDAANPANNFFNSSATEGGVPFTGRDPPYPNLLGFDVDQVDASGLFGHAATATTLTLTTNGDAYFPGVITFTVDLYAPKIVTTMTSTDVDGGDLLPGDQIEYRIAVLNDGSDTADGVALSDAIPPYTAYVPGSLTVQGTPLTDASGDDAGWFAAGAAGWNLGSIPYQGTTYVTFRVQVGTGAPPGYAITNLVNASYTGHTTSVSVAGLAGAVATPVLRPHTDRAATVAVTPAFVQRASAPNAITYTATVTNAAGDLEPTAGVELTLPVGVTPGALPAGCAAAGQVVTCSLGPLVAGSSASASIPALADATAATGATAAVRATGTGTDGSPGNDTDTVGLRVNSPPVAVADAAITALGTAVNVRVRDNDTDPEDPVTGLLVSIVTPPAHGSVVVEADQTVTYTPGATWGGADLFTYRIDDQNGGTATAVATVTTGNAGPAANDDTINTPGNTPVDIDVLDNDRDPNNDPLTVTAVTQPPAAQGSVTRAGNLVTFTPDSVYHGSVTFGYAIADGNGGTATAQVTVNVENLVPTAADDLASVPYQPGTPVLITVLDNDTDPNNDTLTVTAAGPATPAGAAVALASGGVELTTPAGFSGDVTFGYTIGDGHGGSATARATVTVGNAAPAAVGFAQSTAYRTPFTLDVAAAGSDPNHDPLRVAGVTAPANGTVVRDPAGTITYLPAIGFSGADGFSYTLDDGHGGTATAAVTVTVANGVAGARNDHATVAGGTPVVINVLANDDDDPNGDPLTMTTDAVPADGTATIGADQRITYLPDTGFVGTDTFHYRLDDGNGGITGATVTVTVVNLPPVAQPDAVSTDFGTAVAITVLAGDSDPNGDQLTVSTAAGAAHGTVTPGPGQAVTYTPDTGFSGTDSFLYTIVDPFGLADSAVVTVTVRNAPPVAVDDRIPVWPNVLTTLPLLANDHDPNTGQVLQISSVGVAGKGTVTLTGSTVTYRSLAGATGTDTFAYVLADDAGGTATATVTIVINGRPVAVDDIVSTSWATPVDIPVTANDTDPDQDALAVSWVGAPTNGVTGLNPDGTVHYLPDRAFVGSATFGYVVRDPAGNIASAQVTVAVTVPAGPTAVPDRRTTPYRRAVTIPVLANDLDPTGSLEVTSVTQPANGTVTFTGTAVTYAPPDGFSGVVRFHYTASEILGNTSTAEVEVTVQAALTMPDKEVTGRPGAAVGITPPDRDSGGNPVTVRRIGRPAHGTAVLNPDGTVTYTPEPGFTGTDSFTYEVVDADGNVAQASIIVSVPPATTPAPTPLPPPSSPTPTPSAPTSAPTSTSTSTSTSPSDPPSTPARGSSPATRPADHSPVAVDDTVTVVTGDSVVLRPLMNDRDPDGDTLHLTKITKPAYGAAVADPDGEVTYAAAGARAGQVDSFGYTVADGRGGTASATVTIRVAASHALPVTGRDAYALIRAGLAAAATGGILYWLGGRGLPGRLPTREPA